MNGKSTLCLLLTLIAIMAITDSSYATPIINKYNIEGTLAYWTPERMKRARPLIPKNVGIRNKKRYDVNTTRDARNGTDSKIMPPLAPSARLFDTTNEFGPSKATGMLFFNDPDTGDLYTCGASVINTANGNIGITSGHCLIDADGNPFKNLMFSPGYDHGQDGPFGRIAVAVVQVTDEFRSTFSGTSDYGMMRFAFNDPNGGNLPLQHYTGSHGWRFDLNTDVPTAILGYSYQGNVPDCPNDAKSLCLWSGNTTLGEDFYTTPADAGISFGDGASGAPWIWRYDPSTNLGWLYGTLTGFDPINQQSLSPIFNENVYRALVDYVSTH